MNTKISATVYVPSTRPPLHSKRNWSGEWRIGKTMIPQRRGKIINIASTAGLHGAGPEVHAIGYHASKGGLITFTKELACKWAMHNIHVNAIAPGWFPTNMSEVLIERNQEALRKKIL